MQAVGTQRELQNALSDAYHLRSQKAMLEETLGEVICCARAPVVKGAANVVNYFLYVVRVMYCRCGAIYF